jgi:P22 coat protein - gene protein 5.
MATNAQTRGTHEVFIPEVWSNEMLLARRNKLVLAEHVTRHDRDVMKFGDVIHVPRVSEITAKTTTPGSPLDFDATTEGEFTISITSFVYKAFLVPDMLKAQSKYDNRSIYVEQSTFAIAKQVDSDLFTLATAHTGVTNAIGSTTNTSTRLAKTFFTAANRYLDIANAPDEDRYFSLEGYGYEQLLNIDDFVRYDALGRSKIENGRVGTLYGLNLLKTNQVPAKTTNVKNGIFFHKSGIALAMQVKETVESQYDIDYLGWKTAAYNQYGHGIARTDHVGHIYYGIG